MIIIAGILESPDKVFIEYIIRLHLNIFMLKSASVGRILQSELIPNFFIFWGRFFSLALYLYKMSNCVVTHSLWVLNGDLRSRRRVKKWAMAPPPVLALALPSETGRVLSIQSHTVQVSFYKYNFHFISIISKQFLLNSGVHCVAECWGLFSCNWVGMVLDDV